MGLDFDRLREVNDIRGLEWIGDHEMNCEDLLFRATELGGEAGEAQNEIKKYARTLKGMVGGISYETALEKIADELADVIICCDRVASFMDIDLSEAVVRKFNKTSEKNGLKTVFTDD